jgi:hypothetical protein
MKENDLECYEILKKISSRERKKKTLGKGLLLPWYLQDTREILKKGARITPIFLAEIRLFEKRQLQHAVKHPRLYHPEVVRVAKTILQRQYQAA